MINDQHGHLAGDSALKEIANIIQKMCVRLILWDVSGEEFCVVLPDTEMEGRAWW